nr:NS2 [Yonaguni orbivirus]
MEQQRQVRAVSGDRIPRTPIRTFVLYSSTNDNFVGKTCSALQTKYLAVKLGTSTHIQGVSVPVPRSTVILISGPCAFKIIDKETTCHFMISSGGIETRLGRWNQYKFETVETKERPCMMEIGGQNVEESIRLGKATGIVPPYTEEEMAVGGDDIDLPGVKFVNVESNEIPEMRERLRLERGTKRDLIGMALKESGATRGEGRLFGVKPETVAKMQTVKKVTTRIQGKDMKDKGDKTPESAFPLDQKAKPQRSGRASFSPLIKEINVEEEETVAISPNAIAKMMRQHAISEPGVQFKTFSEEVSLIESTSLAEKLRQSAQSTPVHFSPIMNGGFTDIEPLKTKIIAEPVMSPQLVQTGFKLNDEYKTLTAMVQSDERLPPELSMLELGMPVKMGAFEKVATTYNFSSGGLLPVFNVNTSSNEYKFVGFERVSRAVLVISAGNVLILPVY